MRYITTLTRSISLAMLLAFVPVIANAGEVLRVLAWPGYADADLVQVFEQRYRVKVEVTTISSDDVMWQRLSAGQGRDFDVFAVNTAELQRYIDNGISVPVVPADIPNTAKQLKRFSDLAAIPGITRNGAVYAIPYTYSEMGLIYDRKSFKTPPDTFSALWDKRYKGRVLAYQASEHNFSLAAMVLGLKNPFRIPAADFKRVSRHLIALRRNVLTFYSSPEEATELFMRNHVALLFANYGTQQLDMLKKAGADIGYVIPKEGALAWLDCWSITHGAKNRKLAEAWINYTLEMPVSHALTERQGLSNTLEVPSTVHDSDKILWLQRVEDVGRRAAIWEKIISGTLPEKF
ncbi:extracellular solute-binding protein [Sideroxydans lithotrophicus]|uniref:Extracellular solute-binding protein family 1 n=1 Tax=Sideroxydans lithotrophicus (strain ES-1) TaxID=580332 RepID=D5CSG2_SIDLE|nr:extracellular solute-binding protein [Sideroxydans lithotrophicus]ADE11898.1 extracellular solute-binding protein family 1 [Sideroxydans lithotrophicus ES-1]